MSNIIVLPSGVDLNALVGAGFYVVSDPRFGPPSLNHDFIIIAVAGSNGGFANGAQIAWDIGTGGQYGRTKEAGAWTEWTTGGGSVDPSLFDPAGAADAAVAAHVADADPHPQYLLSVDAATSYDVIGAATAAIAALKLESNPFPQYLSETTADTLYQPLDAELGVIAGLTFAANKIIRLTGAGSADLIDATTLGVALLGASSAGAARTALGLVIGTDVQGYDADLSQLASLSPTKGTILVGDGSAWQDLGVGSDTWVVTADSSQTVGVKWAPQSGGGGGGAVTDGDYGDIVVSGTGTVWSLDSGVVTTFARTFLDDTSASAVRTTLGLAIGTDVQAHDTDLDAWALVNPSAYSDTATIAAGYQPLDSDLTAIALLTTTTFGRSLLTQANASAARTTLGVAIGTDVQAFNTNLTTYAGIAPSSNAQTLLGHTFAQMRTDLSLVVGTNVQAWDADLDTWATLTPSANAQSLVTAANYAAMKVLLGLTVGTDVQAQDAELSAIAGLTSAADQLPYFTGSGTAALTTLTTTGRSLIDDTSTSAMRTTLGLVIGTDVQAHDTDLDTWAGLTPSANFQTLVTETFAAMRTSLGLAIGTDVQAFNSNLTTYAGIAPSANAQTILGHTFAQMRSDLGLVIGTNVQAWDTDLDTWATLTPSANFQTLVTHTFAQMRTDLGLGSAALVNTGTSGGTVPLLNASNAFGAQQSLSYAGTATLVLVNSTAPVGAINIGALVFDALNSSSAVTAFAEILATGSTVTAGAETAALNFYTTQAGSGLVARMVIAAGVVGQGTTGGDKGVNTLNFGTLYESGVSLAAKYGQLSVANAWTAAQNITSVGGIGIQLAQLVLEGTAGASIAIKNTTGTIPADSSVWEFFTGTGGGLSIRAVNDAGSAAGTFLACTRTGTSPNTATMTTVTSLTFTSAAISLVGAAAVTGGLTVSGAITQAGERVMDIGDISEIVWTIDGGGSAITTGVKGFLRVPFAGTLVDWDIALDQSGSIVIDLWKDTTANFPPTIADVITASAKPTVTTAQHAASASLTGWTTAVAAGDFIAFNVNSITTATRATITLKIMRT